MLGEEECISWWGDILVPPRFDNSEYLTTLHTDNRSATIRINNNQKNKRCEVELYQVRCGEQQQIIDHADINEDGEIVVKLDSANIEIKARIKYKGFENWSPWISSELPVSISISYQTICDIDCITDCRVPSRAGYGNITANYNRISHCFSCDNCDSNIHSEK